MPAPECLAAAVHAGLDAGARAQSDPGTVTGIVTDSAQAAALTLTLTLTLRKSAASARSDRHEPGPRSGCASRRHPGPRYQAVCRRGSQQDPRRAARYRPANRAFRAGGWPVGRRSTTAWARSARAGGPEGRLPGLAQHSGVPGGRPSGPAQHIHLAKAVRRNASACSPGGQSSRARLPSGAERSRWCAPLGPWA